MRRLIAVLILLLSGVNGAPAAEVAVPGELDAWRNWALQGAEYRRCPFLASRSATDEQSFRCAWPGTLNLTLDARGGSFTQRWQTYSDTWIALPGSSEYWPTEVRSNGATLAVVLRDGVPQTRVAAGSYAISGRFSWQRRPEQLAIASQTGLVNLRLDGNLVAQAERPGGALWLGQPRATETQQSLALQVYRVIQDEIPAILVTHLRLQVAGDGREEQLARVLPDGFTPIGITGELPARLDANGRLRVQVRPGSYELIVRARGTGVAANIARPVVQGRWVDEEIWSFAGIDRLRVAAAEGAESIDPAQANVPEAWRGYPAFRMSANSSLRVVERSRGLANDDDNQLKLSREQWLDFNHAGFTVVDNITGKMRTGWRLDMLPPHQLKSARIDEESQLVTAGQKGTGVELRSPEVDLHTTSRVAGTRSALNATGWDTRFEAATGVLYLPPGHRLLGVVGADEARGSWWSRWTLWSLFGVLIVVAMSFRIAGAAVGAVALAALLLTYMEAPLYIWLWLNALVAVALARATVSGRLAAVANRYRIASLALLGIALLPLLWGQLRLAIYPQLEASDYGSAVAAVMAAPANATIMADAPPQPAMERSRAVDEIVVTAQRRVDPGLGSYSTGSVGQSASQTTQRYATGTVLQTGPGIPSWNYNSYSYFWSGPVAADETVRFIYIGPWLLAVWRVLGVALLALWFASLLTHAMDLTPRLPPRWQEWIKRVVPAALLLVLLPWSLPGTAHGANTPDPAVLQELRSRLLAAPRCAPSCGEINAAQVQVTGNRVAVTLQVSALSSVALPVPNAADRWQLESVTIDGNVAATVGREGDNSLWVPLTAGVHTVRMTAGLSNADSIPIAFPQAPRTISASATGWDIAGIADARLVSGSLELTRRRVSSTVPGTNGGGGDFPGFVRVIRDFNLDTEWSIGTTVQRIAPATAATTVEVPLVTGESVLNAALEIRQRGAARVALVGLAANQSQLEWNSALPRSDVLELRVPTDAARAEVWNFAVNPQWRVAFAGIPAVLPDAIDAPVWIYQYRPRPGEVLKLTITRPAAVAGQVLAIDSAQQQVSFGARSADVKFELSYRSTQGGRHSIKLPAGVRVQEVRVDDQPLALRPENGELSIALLPGAHKVTVDWQSGTGVALRSRSNAVDLRAPASNVATTIVMPSNRWPLYATRSLAGPVVRYWGELLVLLLTALLLGRWRHSPLRSHEWLLLGLGLSTLSWLVFALVAIWLFAIRWRSSWNASLVKRWQYRTVQVAFAALTVIAVGSLVFSGIRYGFLSSPEMGVAGAGSYGNHFNWFHDQLSSQMPVVAVYSVPLWSYKALIFAWALWVALALTRWLRQAWTAWMAGDANV